MKIYLKTYGCQANIADSEKIAGLIQQASHTLVNAENRAELLIVNSCSVKNKTQSKILYYIEQQLKANKKVFVGGCLPKTINLRKKFSGLTSIFDTNSISKIQDIIEKPKDVFSNKKENKLALPLSRKDKNIGVITISEGCLTNCNFCATKLARGNLSSCRIGDIKRSVKKAINEGCTTIYLTSQDNGCYGFDIKTSLPELLKELVSIPGNYKIRVGMLNPQYLKKILKPLIAAYNSEKILKFLHIPVQSGSNKVLKEMSRGHSAEDFINAAKIFRKNFPNITISTDIIIGYPTETGSDFQATIDLIKLTKPEVLNISKFSSRPRTRASRLKQLSSEIIKERSKEIHELYKKYKKES